LKFIPKEPDGNVNVSQQSPLRDMFQLVAGFLGLVLLVFLGLGLLVDYGVQYIPASTESKLLGGEFWAKALGSGEILESETEYVQSLVDEMVKEIREEGDYPETWFTARVVSNPQENAFATAGGQIFITSGFLEAAQSENELVMVIGHEIGHILNRDPLRSMGRGLILVLLYSFAGENLGENSLFSTTLDLGHSGYSRKQEFSADEIGLDFLVDKYGHASGSTDFFRRMDEKDGSSGHFGSDFKSTHPDSGRRVNVIEELVEERGVTWGDRVENSFVSQN